MNKDLKNNVEVEQDEYVPVYTDPGNAKDNVFARATMDKDGTEKIKEAIKGTMREATVIAEQVTNDVKERFGKESIEYQATSTFQEEILKDFATLRREMDEKFDKIQDQLAMIALNQKNIRADGSAGGHNGIKSIIGEVGSQNFPRVKIGVGAKPHPEMDLADWVLSTFSAQEEKNLKNSLEWAAEAALAIIDYGVPEAANRYNGKQ